MKKLFTLCIAALIICTCSLTSNASIVTVNVEDFEFGPEIFTINAGDTIIWMWDNSAGSHTTTSTNIPSGAAPWDQPINQNSQVFAYVPTVGGSYDYECSIHVSMGMTGHFTVIGSTGIDANAAITSTSLNVTNLIADELQIIYSIHETTALIIRLYNIIGNEVGTFVSLSSQGVGIYSQPFAIPNLPRGIYVVRLETQDATLSQKILIP